jgi:hypothetical protein
MATNMKNSLLTNPRLFILLVGALTIGSCKENPAPKDQVCISVPEDKSQLGQINHFISEQEMKRYIKVFDAQRDSIHSKVPEIFIPNSEAFNKAWLAEILKDTAVKGLKFYYGIRPGEEKRKALRLMIVGVDAAGQNIYIKGKRSALAAEAASEEGGLEYGQCTPPCDIQP